LFGRTRADARALVREYFVARARAVRNKAPATMELLKAVCRRVSRIVPSHATCDETGRNGDVE